jgi:hypothetical protein
MSSTQTASLAQERKCAPEPKEGPEDDDAGASGAPDKRAVPICQDKL